MGGGGGLQVHNHAPSGPNLQVRTCKNSSQVEFQVGPEYGNNLFQQKGMPSYLFNGQSTTDKNENVATLGSNLEFNLN